MLASLKKRKMGEVSVSDKVERAEGLKIMEDADCVDVSHGQFQGTGGQEAANHLFVR